MEPAHSYDANWANVRRPPPQQSSATPSPHTSRATPSPTASRSSRRSMDAPSASDVSSLGRPCAMPRSSAMMRSEPTHRKSDDPRRAMSTEAARLAHHFPSCCVPGAPHDSLETTFSQVNCAVASELRHLGISKNTRTAPDLRKRRTGGRFRRPATRIPQENRSLRCSSRQRLPRSRHSGS